jgi:hypothetical protein
VFEGWETESAIIPFLDFSHRAGDSALRLCNFSLSPETIWRTFDEKRVSSHAVLGANFLPRQTAWFQWRTVGPPVSPYRTHRLAIPFTAVLVDESLSAFLSINHLNAETLRIVRKWLSIHNRFPHLKWGRRSASAESKRFEGRILL